MQDVRPAPPQDRDACVCRVSVCDGAHLGAEELGGSLRRGRGTADGEGAAPDAATESVRCAADPDPAAPCVKEHESTVRQASCHGTQTPRIVSYQKPHYGTKPGTEDVLKDWVSGGTIPATCRIVMTNEPR